MQKLKYPTGDDRTLISFCLQANVCRTNTANIKAITDTQWGESKLETPVCELLILSRSNTNKEKLITPLNLNRDVSETMFFTMVLLP